MELSMSPRHHPVLPGAASPGWERGAGGEQLPLGWAGARCLPRGHWTLSVPNALVGLG